MLKVYDKRLYYTAYIHAINMAVMPCIMKKMLYLLHICRVFLRLTTEEDSIDVMSLLQRELIPIRNDRQYPRLQTAHFRKPRYFIYRAA